MEYVIFLLSLYFYINYYYCSTSSVSQNLFSMLCVYRRFVLEYWATWRVTGTHVGRLVTTGNLCWCPLVFFILSFINSYAHIACNIILSKYLIVHLLQLNLIWFGVGCFRLLS